MSEHSFDHEAFLRTLTQRSGVYRLMDGAGEVLYVGKARNLRNRVASYFRGSATSAKVTSSSYLEPGRSGCSRRNRPG